MSPPGTGSPGTRPPELDFRVREATREDLPAIVAMLADDALGSGRELLMDPLPAAYAQAFAAIDGGPAPATRRAFLVLFTYVLT